MKKKDCLTKSDVRAVVEEYICKGLLTIFAIGFVYFIGSIAVKDIWVQGCHSMVEYYSTCEEMYSGKTSKTEAILKDWTIKETLKEAAEARR